MKERKAIFYGWFIVAASVLMHVMSYGARYSFAVIFPSLLEEFHWPRDATAAVLSVHLLVYGLVAPAAGSMIDSIGPRKTMGLGATLLTLGLLLSAGGSEPWHFYFSFGILFGIGLCLTGSVPLTTVLRNWFERKRGMAFSLAHLGSGASFALYPAIAFMINGIGWRWTFVVEALVAASIIIPLIAFVVKYHPREKGLVRDGDIEPEDTSTAALNEARRITDQAWAATDWRLSQAMRTSRFWLLCLTTFSVWGVMLHIMAAHHVAFAIDVGYTKLYASSVLSLFGIMAACGGLAALVSDWIGREPTITIGTIIGISGILILTFIEDTSHPWMLYYYALALGFGQGMISPTITASITDIFQGPKVGSIIGFIWFSFALGGTIGPWLGGWIFEFTGHYRPAFILSMALLALSCAAIWLAAPRKVRLVPGRVRTRQNK